MAATKQEFNTVATSTWAVPSGVTSITVKAWGAAGGGGGGGDNSPAAPGGTGGGGGYITGTVSVTPLENLTIVVGDDGKGGAGDTTNGGGGGGGGGYTIVGRGTSFYGAASNTILFLAAGGGGGGGGDDTTTVDGGAGGAGGGSSGADGATAGTGLLGGGGTQISGGAGGSTNCDFAGANGGPLTGGGGGAQTGTSPGLGGAGGVNGGGQGGNGNTTGSDSGGAGAGGAGYFGGGGGCTDESTDGAGGGGGGSSFATTTATGVTNTAGSGVDPGNNGDSDYTTYCSALGVGGTAGAAGAGNGGNGSNGCVVIIYNLAPAFTADVPAESADPVDTGTNVSFTATADDPDSDSWYLTICSSDSVSPGSGGGAPTCGGTQYCVSSATTDNTQASCTWTSPPVGQNSWYGFACDNSSVLTSCSSSNGANSPLSVKGTLTLADHTAGQLTDQFGSQTSTTTELFGFKLTPNGENASTTLTISLSSITGISDTDITSGNVYIDSDSNGRISVSETTTAFGCGNPSIAGASGTITCNATTTISAATDYIYKATVSNLQANDTITFSLSSPNIVAIGISSKTYSSRLTVSGSATNASHNTDAAASLTFVVSTNTFPTITPGSPVFATTTLSVDTDNSTGWNVTVSRDDSDTTIDLDSDATVNITDQTAWSPGAATTTAGNAVRISSLDSSGDVLAMRIMVASGTVSFISTAWWGTTDAYTDSATTLWAGFNSTAKKIGDSSASSGGSAKLNTVLYYLDVPSTQKTGAYSGGITYTATMNP